MPRVADSLNNQNINLTGNTFDGLQFSVHPWI
jgi:hypothetical protein